MHKVVMLILLVVSGQAAFGQTGRESLLLDEATTSKCLTILRQGMKGDDFWPGIHAAEGLTLGGYGSEVVAWLTPLVPNETDDQKRCGLARELARAGQRQHLNTMLDILAGDNSWGHTHAAESLYKVYGIGDGTRLRNAFQTATEMKLKLMAAGALARCGNPDMMAYLRQMLEHNDPEVLKIAAWLLGRIGDAGDIPRIREQLPRCEDVLLKAYLHHSLAALGDADGLQQLKRNLQHEDSAVRTYAATFAGDAWATDAKDLLVAMLNDVHPDAAIRAAQSLLQMSRPAPPSRAEDISVVVYPSTAANPRYTEGSVLPLMDGSLLFAVTEFSGNGSDFASAQIIARQSGDEGRTWSDSRVLQKNTGGMNCMSVTLRRMADGRVALFYLQKNSTSDLDLYVRFSTDEAATFGDAILVTNQPGYHVVNNDRIAQLKNGRLLAPAASTPDVEASKDHPEHGHFVSHCFLSDDGGATWRLGKGHVDADRRGAMEPEVLELSDGRVLMLIRNQLGYIGRSYSSDQGETWSPMESLGLQAPEAPSTVRRVPSTGDLMLVWNDTYDAKTRSGGARTPLSVAVSRDDGQTWSKVGDLETNPKATYSYTSLTFNGDRILMSYWDTSVGAGRFSCRFRSLPVSWLYASSPVSSRN